MHMPSVNTQITHANGLWLFPCTIIPSAPASKTFAYSNEAAVQCCLFGFRDTLSVSVIASGAPHLDEAQHWQWSRARCYLPVLTSPGASSANWKDKWDAVTATPNTWRCKQSFKHGWNAACMGSTQEHIKCLSDSHCKAAPWQGPGAVTKSSLHIPTQPCPAAGRPFCSFQASLIQLFI